MIKEKKHRLPRSEYVGFKRVSFTFCIDGKKRIFNDSKITNEFIEILRRVIDKHCIKNWIYVFMPDHVHLVLEGRSSKSDIWQAMKDFKQHTGFYMARYCDCKWQKDYYDHIHRENENMFNNLYYIANNPVRKGLVKNCLDYKGLGSLDLNINEIVERIQTSLQLYGQ